jgi:hypothetical protein
MIDATTNSQGRHPASHIHAHPQGAHEHSAKKLSSGRASLIETSAAARLSGVLLLIAALWASACWALH